MAGIVIAWHTPDKYYTGLAQKLARQLDRIGQRYLLYCIEKTSPDESWTDVITRTKTTIWRKAMLDAPGRPLLFLDVDCNINGPLDPLFDEMTDTDIGLAIHWKQHRKRETFLISTRALLMNQTHAAIEFMEAWERVSIGQHNEEKTLKILFGANDFSASIKKIPERYSAKEIGWAPDDAVISHTSAHKVHLPLVKRIEHRLRAAYRSVITNKNTRKVFA